MNKYIDADKLIAEIKQHIHNPKQIEDWRYRIKMEEDNALLERIVNIITSLQQEQPDFDDIDPKHLVHSHYTKVRETKTGRVFWAEYSSEAAEWYEAGTGNVYSISDVEIVKELLDVDLEKEIECSIRFLNGYHTLENGERWYKGRYEELRDFARHFYELGLNATKEE